MAISGPRALLRPASVPCRRFVMKQERAGGSWRNLKGALAPLLPCAGSRWGSQSRVREGVIAGKGTRARGRGAVDPAKSRAHPVPSQAAPSIIVVRYRATAANARRQTGEQPAFAGCSCLVSPYWP